MTPSEGAELVMLIALSPWLFWAMAVVSDLCFVPALCVLAERARMPKNVAGATLMAGGASMPELLANVVSIYVTKSDVGVGTIVGSEIFNHAFILASVCAGSTRPQRLDRATCARDVVFYVGALAALVLAVSDVERDGSTDDAVGAVVRLRTATTAPLAGWYVLYVLACTTMGHRAFAWLVGADATSSGADDDADDAPESRNATNPDGGLAKANACPDDDDDEDDDAESRRRTPPEKRPLMAAKASRKKKAAWYGGATRCRELVVGPAVRGPDDDSKAPPRDVKLDEATPVSAVRLSWADDDDVSDAVDWADAVVEEDSCDLCNLQFVEAETRWRDDADGARRHRRGPLDLAWPEGTKGARSEAPSSSTREAETSSYWGPTVEAAAHILVFPVKLALAVTLPSDPRDRPGAACVSSVVWLVALSYAMVCVLERGAQLLGVLPSVVGLTVGAVGTSFPNVVAAAGAANRGLANMAVSSALGANVFNLCVGLGLPWLLYPVVFDKSAASYKGLHDTNLSVLTFLLIAVTLGYAALLVVTDCTLYPALAFLFILVYLVFIFAAIFAQSNFDALENREQGGH